MEAATRSNKASPGRAESLPASWSPTTVDTGGECVSGREVEAGCEIDTRVPPVAESIGGSA